MIISGSAGEQYQRLSYWRWQGNGKCGWQDRRHRQHNVSTSNVSVSLHGTLQFDLVGAGSMTAIGAEIYDSVNSNDLLRISTTGGVDLSNSSVVVAASNSTGWGEGQTWKLIDWSMQTAASLNTTNLQLTTTFLNGWYLIPTLVTTGSGAGYYITASAAPEPGKATLAMLGLVFFMTQRRRCRR